MQLGSHVERSQLLPLLRFIYTGQAAIACSADDAKALQRLAGKDVMLKVQLLPVHLPAQALAVLSAKSNRVASPDSQLQVLRHCTQPNARHDWDTRWQSLMHQCHQQLACLCTVKVA